ncbi:MAG: hypothetical protein AAB897_01750 [Patescibacteria group bacterium]
MKRAICSVLFFLTILFCGYSSAYAGNDNEFARWNELQTGQVGYMDTVFQGTVIQRMKVIYVGTTPHPVGQSEADRAIVIALIDKELAPKMATAVAGTSGSPVYFKVRKKLRLVGAAAFMFSAFPVKGTIMGVTPIEMMIAGTGTPLTELPRTLKIENFGEFGIRWLPIYLDQQKLRASAAVGATPASRRPVQGDSVTVHFPSGGGGICTVTYVHDDRFWACGHSILRENGEKSVAFPSYRTQITITVYSAESSYKMYDRDLEFFGTITRNTSFSIEGKVHAYGQNP